MNDTTGYAKNYYDLPQKCDLSRSVRDAWDLITYSDAAKHADSEYVIRFVSSLMVSKLLAKLYQSGNL